MGAGGRGRGGVARGGLWLGSEREARVVSLRVMQAGTPSMLGRMPTIREPDVAPMPLVAILDDEGQMTGITCPLNVGVDPHDIEGCEDLLESYFMQVRLSTLQHMTHEPAYRRRGMAGGGCLITKTGTHV